MLNNIRNIIFLLSIISITYAQTAYKSEKDLIKNADALFNKENFEAALPLFSHLLSVYPKSTEYNYKFGVCVLMADKRDMQQPLRYLEFASQDADVDKELFFYLGLAYHLNYRFSEAINAYNTFLEHANKKLLAKHNAQRQIEMCQNGINLLNNISDLYVLERHHVGRRNFYRSYNGREFDGRFLMLPPELKTKLDIKNEHNPLVFYNDKHTYLYYSSYGAKGENGKDLYRVFKNQDGTWGRPERLSDIINTPFDEDYPFVLADELTLFFSSKGHNSMGGYDIFISYFDTMSLSWSKPENLDFAINTPYDDIMFITDSLMQNAFFASNRVADIGMVNVYKVRIDTRIDDEEHNLAEVFNLAKDDPAYKKALELLYNKTKLEVNATEGMFEKTVLVDNLISKPIKEEFVKKSDKTDMDDILPEDIIKMAFDNAEEIKKDLDKLLEKEKAAQSVVEDRKQKALIRLDEANNLRNEAVNTKELKLKEDIIIEAARVKNEAERLTREAEIAEGIYNDIVLKTRAKKNELDNTQNYADAIKKAIESESTEDAIAILEKMTRGISNEEKTYIVKSLDDIIAEAIGNIPQTKNEMLDLKNSVDELQVQAEALRKEAQKTRNKNTKEDLLLQAQIAEDDANALKSELNQLMAAVDPQILTLSETNLSKDEKQQLSGNDRLAEVYIEKESEIDTLNKEIGDANNVIQRTGIDESELKNRKTDIISKTDSVLVAFDESLNKLKVQKDDLVRASELYVSESQVAYIAYRDIVKNKTLNDSIINLAQNYLNEAQLNTMKASAVKDLLVKFEEQIKQQEQTSLILTNKRAEIIKYIDSDELNAADVILTEALSIIPTPLTSFLSISEKETNKSLRKNEKELAKQKKLSDREYLDYVKSLKELTDLRVQKQNIQNDIDLKRIEKQIEVLEVMNTFYLEKAEAYQNNVQTLNFEIEKIKTTIAITTNLDEIIAESKNKSVTKDNVGNPLLPREFVKEQTKLTSKKQEQIVMAEAGTPLSPFDIVADSQLIIPIKDVESIVSQKLEIEKMNQELLKLSESFEVKAERLHQYASDAALVAKIALEESSTLIDNAQSLTNENLRRQDLYKASEKQEEAVELSQKALAAATASHDIKKQLGLLDNYKRDLETTINELNNLVDNESWDVAEELINNTKVKFVFQDIEKQIVDNLYQIDERALTIKEQQANNLFLVSNKQYEEALKLHDEAKSLQSKAQITNDLFQKNELIAQAKAKEVQSIERKKDAEESYNKGSQLKIEVGAMRMKVQISMAVDDLPEIKMDDDILADAKLHTFNDVNTFVQTQNFAVKLEDMPSLNINVSEMDVLTEVITTNEEDVVITDEDVIAGVIITNEEDGYVTERRQSETIIENNNFIEQSDENKIQTPLFIAPIDVTELNTSDEIEVKEQEVAKLIKQEKESLKTAKTAQQKHIYQENIKELENQIKKLDLRSLEIVAEQNVKTIDENKILIENIKTNSEDEFAVRARLLEDEVVFYKNKAEQRKNEAAANDIIELKQNLLDDALRNQKLALQKQDEVKLNWEKSKQHEQDIAAQRRLDEEMRKRQEEQERKAKEEEMRLKLVEAERQKQEQQQLAIQNRELEKQNEIEQTSLQQNNTVSIEDNRQAEFVSEIQVPIEKPNVTIVTTPYERASIEVDKYLITQMQGLLFTVQIGVFAGTRSSQQLLNLDPIYHDRLNNGHYRYFSGIYNAFAEANNHKNNIVSRGIGDAFVVAYNNGVRMSVREALAMVEAGNVSMYAQASSSSQQDINKPNDNASTVDNSNTFYYAVQVGVYRNRRPSEQLFGITPLTYEGLNNGLQRHLHGVFDSRQKAENAKNDVVRRGVADAFVVAYYNGKRVSMAEATRIEQNLGGSTPLASQTLTQNQSNTISQTTTPSTISQPVVSSATTSSVVPLLAEAPPAIEPTYNKDNIIFKIQIGAFRNAISLQALKQYRDLLNTDIEVIRTETGLTIYLVGNFKDFIQASALRTRIVNAGINDAFVVAYHNNDRISVTKAREVLR